MKISQHGDRWRLRMNSTEYYQISDHEQPFEITVQDEWYCDSDQRWYVKTYDVYFNNQTELIAWHMIHT